MRVIQVRAKVTTVCVASEAFDAEIELETENGDTLYLHLNECDGKRFSVSKTSIYDYMTNLSSVDPKAKFIEMYYSLNSARKSKYAKYFNWLHSLINKL